MTESLGIYAYVVKAHLHFLQDYYAEMPNTPLRDTLARNARNLREARRMTQSAVAAAAKRHGRGLDQTTVGRIERGDIAATVDMVDSLALGLGVPPLTLLSASEPAHEARVALAAIEESAARINEVLRPLPAEQRDALMRSFASALLAASPVSDDKLGAAWARPDRATTKK